MECGEVEIGAIGLLQKDARLDRIDYAGETIDFGWVKPHMKILISIKQEFGHIMFADYPSVNRMYRFIAINIKTCHGHDP